MDRSTFVEKEGAWSRKGLKLSLAESRRPYCEWERESDTLPREFSHLPDPHADLSVQRNDASYDNLAADRNDDRTESRVTTGRSDDRGTPYYANCRDPYGGDLRFSMLYHDEGDWKTDIAKPTSTLYALLIVISNIALSVSARARRDNHIPVSYSKWFDAILYGVSIIFLLIAMLFLFDGKRYWTWKQRLQRMLPSDTPVDVYPNDDDEETELCRPRTKSSVYLKINAIICGVGALIFSCLEFGVWISNRDCYETILGVIPLLVIIFVSVQTYFIFLYSKRVIRRHTIFSRFGLMHLVATDITIWLRVLIDQTLYEFTVYRVQDQEGNITRSDHSWLSAPRAPAGLSASLLSQPSASKNHGYGQHPSSQSISTLSSPACMQQESILGEVLVNASVFLYPCIIGYAVISAGIIYIICRNMVHSHEPRPSPAHFKRRSSDANPVTGCHSSHPQPVHRLYWLDCDQAVGGLLSGSIVLAMTIVCLILFFIFKNRNPDLAMLEVQIGETILYFLGIGATAVAFFQTARKLPKRPDSRVSWELDSAMLLVSVVGVYAFSVLSIIGSNDDTPGMPINTMLVILTSALAIVQATLQTIYIFEASHRAIPQPEHGSVSLLTGLPSKIHKPGRNALTFLIVINLAFWNMNIFKTLRSEASPTQRQFFGVYEWTIITHVTVPLTLLYRFHSAAGLFEIWKHAYKLKPAPEPPTRNTAMSNQTGWTELRPGTKLAEAREGSPHSMNTVPPVPDVLGDSLFASRL